MAAAKDLAPHAIRVNTVMPALIGPENGYMWARQNTLHAASGSPYFKSDPEQVKLWARALDQCGCCCCGVRLCTTFVMSWCVYCVLCCSEDFRPILPPLLKHTRKTRGFANLLCLFFASLRASFALPRQVAAAKVASVPLKRLGEVEEVVSAVAYLLSEESSYVTGTSLVVAGGLA